ncbi:MAG: hypothetical protein RSE36_03210 [Oscillospiraceae bacterium]
MLKFAKKLVLLLIPSIIVTVLFFIFEPYNYFGFHKGADYMSKPLSSVRELLREQPENIILGDSRMANLNTDLIKEASGDSYTMMAFGGATLNDSINEFWYAAKHTKLKKVVWCVSFYLLNDNHSTDKFSLILDTAENPARYFLSYPYWEAAYKKLFASVSNGISDLTGNESLLVVSDDPSDYEHSSYTPSKETTEGYRSDLFDYSNIIYAQCVDYGGNLGYMHKLEEIAAYCDENGIELVFVLPPANGVIWDRVVYPLGIDFYINLYKDKLKSMATVYDMEFDNDYARNDENFWDGFHLSIPEKKRMIRTVFGDESDESCVVTSKEQYMAAQNAQQDAKTDN